MERKLFDDKKLSIKVALSSCCRCSIAVIATFETSTTTTSAASTTTTANHNQSRGHFISIIVL